MSGAATLRRFLTTTLGALALIAGLVTPSTADHEETPRNGLEEVGFHDLGNTGFNTDVFPWVSPDGGLYAAVGTWGIFTGEQLGGGAPENDPCPSNVDDPLSPTKSGVKIVDASEPANPVMAARIATQPGSQNNDVKVLRLDTGGTAGGFEGHDILAHSLEPCGADSLFAQIPGSPFSDPVEERLTGFQLYDVSDPENPVKLGTYNNGGLGVHNLFMFNQGGRAYVAAVFTEVRQLEDPFVRSELQIIDITDPTGGVSGDLGEPVGVWELDDADAQTPEPGPTFDDLCKERGLHSSVCLLHDVWVEDGVAYASWWDAGLILLDVSDPANPVFLGQTQSGSLQDEGNTHVAIPLTIGGQDLVVVGDEDFFAAAEFEAGLTVNFPASLEGFRKGESWTGVAPLAGETADLVYAGTGCSSAEYAAVDVQGKIAIVDEFFNNLGVATCPAYFPFQKVIAAQEAGAIGLVQVANGDTPESSPALGDIPVVELGRADGLPIRDAVIDDGPVNATMGRPTGGVDPWGFMRVIDATNPAAMTEVATFEAPHVRDVPAPPEDVFSAHNPVLGPDGRVYFAWYTDGVRVLEPDQANPGSFREIAWFVPRPTDHEGDLDSDPHMVQEDNFGFWGSWPICHPDTGDLLVFNSDLNRGLYILRAQYDDCRAEPDLALSSDDIALSTQRVRGGDEVTITASVHNLGEASAQGVLVRFEDGGTVIGEDTIASIPPGGAGEATALWTTKHLKGERTLTVTADPADAIAEIDETNNQASVTVLVRGNKVQNASFEESADGSSPDHWTASGETSHVEGGTDGERAVTATAGGTWTSAPIPVEAGRGYEVAVDVAGAKGNLIVEQLSAAGSVLAATTLALDTVGGGAFRTVEGTLTATEGVTEVRVVLTGGLLGTTTFDDVGLWEA